jgi:hypothetical protein
MHKFCICAKDKSRIVFARKSQDFPSMATYLRKKMANGPLIGQALVARRKGVGPKTKKLTSDL